MYNFAPVSDRVAAIRDKYRNSYPTFSSERCQIITDFYKENPNMPGQLKRAYNLYNLIEKMTILVNENELIVGNISKHYRGCTISPEYGGLGWLKEELESGVFENRSDVEEKTNISQEDKQWVIDNAAFWDVHSMRSRNKYNYPEGFEKMLGTGVIPFGNRGFGDGNDGFGDGPIGHFASNYGKVVTRGFKSIKEEAQSYLDAMYGNIMGDNAQKYNFYRSIIVVCDAASLLAKRYAAECKRQADEMEDGKRKTELLTMADSLNHIMEYPARNYWEAVQATYLNHLMYCLDGQMHGLTLGRFDQYCGPFAEADLAAGTFDRAQLQEITDCFFLKIAETSLCRQIFAALNCGGYSSGQHISLGGVKRDGTDATNVVSFLMLESMARLSLHEPPLSCRIHENTPAELWEAAIETTKLVGGIPTLQNDKVIIKCLLDRGFTLEDARDYCLIGCVEPAGFGNDFPCCGGCGAETYINQANIMMHAINNGINPMNGANTGFNTGYLYEFTDFEQVKEAYVKQTEFFVRWHFSLTNMHYMTVREMMPLPSVSATMDGCMEKGLDVTWGGAKYNAMGSSGIGCANVGDGLYAIKHLCFDKKVCTTRELYDALMANWEGHETLRQYILNQMPRYGNDNAEVDELTGWAMEVFAKAFNDCSCYRVDRCQAGIYPVSTHIMFGMNTWATPDGRKKGEPLSDGISPKQGLDKNGPAAVLNSMAKIPHRAFSNGTLLNMKFHPATVAGDEGNTKLRNLVETYFDMDGMHIQYNVMGADQLREAQDDPAAHKNLVIRIAGFSAYFVELDKRLQDDLISRTDQMA